MIEITETMLKSILEEGIDELEEILLEQYDVDMHSEQKIRLLEGDKRDVLSQLSTNKNVILQASDIVISEEKNKAQTASADVVSFFEKQGDTIRLNPNLIGTGKRMGLSKQSVRQILLDNYPGLSEGLPKPFVDGLTTGVLDKLNEAWEQLTEDNPMFGEAMETMGKKPTKGIRGLSADVDTRTPKQSFTRILNKFKFNGVSGKNKNIDFLDSLSALPLDKIDFSGTMNPTELEELKETILQYGTDWGYTGQLSILVDKIEEYTWRLKNKK